MLLRPLVVPSAIGGALALVVACGQGTPSAQQAQAAPVSHRATDRAAVLKADSAWSKAIAGKDMQQAMSFYSTDAIMLLPGKPLAVGKDEIEKDLSDLGKTRGASTSFSPEKDSLIGDVAYEVGSYQLAASHKGRSEAGTGSYVVVWARQPDSTWKVMVDALARTK